VPYRGGSRPRVGPRPTASVGLATLNLLRRCEFGRCARGAELACVTRHGIVNGQRPEHLSALSLSSSGPDGIGRGCNHPGRDAPDAIFCRARCEFRSSRSTETHANRVADAWRGSSWRLVGAVASMSAVRRTTSAQAPASGD
jgi:hypothetical protein